jgi:transglutaminase-like putative cysteine protease
MNRRHSLAFVAGAATILAALPLGAIFASLSWMVYADLGVVLVIGTATLVRIARGPLWTQPLAGLASLTLYLTWSFPSGQELGGLLPTGATLRHFGSLLRDATHQVRDQAVPVPDVISLLMLTTAGIGLVAVLVDLFAVGLRRPALAGLPMLAIYSVPVAVLPQGLSVLPFVFAAAGFLWLLVADSVDRVRRFGRRFSGDGRDIEAWEPSPLASAGRRLGVVGVVVAMLVPLAVPGMTSSLADMFSTNGDSGTGTGTGRGGRGSSTVDLFAMLSGDLVRDREFGMVRFTTNDPTPFYLRFGVADQITSNGFANASPAGGVSLGRLPDYVPPTASGVSTHQYHADVNIINFTMFLAPTFRQVVATQGLDASWFFDSRTDQVFSRRSTTNGRQYGFDFVRVGYTPDALRQAGDLTPDDPANQLTQVPPVPFVSEQVTAIVAGKSTEYDKVRAIYDSFSPTHGFQYSLHAPQGNSGNPIVDFLKAKVGFCVQYSAAMAWLVRVAGYPARVAFGFTRGHGPENGVYTLTNFNLHAWTEVYFPTFGWVPFDPTPAGAIVGSAPSAWAPDPTNPANTGDTGPDVAPGHPTAAPSTSAPAGSGGGQNPGASPGATGTPVNPWWLAAGAGLALVVVLLLTPALSRRSLRRRRRARSDRVVVLAGSADLVEELAGTSLDPAEVQSARRDAHGAWEELLDIMIDYGVPVDPAETPRATAARLGAAPTWGATIRAPAGALARAEERARYARTPLRPTGLDEAVRASRSVLRRQAGRRQRLSAILLPRSVTQRWRRTWFGWTSRGLDTAGRLRAAGSAANPARLISRRAAAR